MRDLIVGYGNVDRQDDGLAWHVLSAVAARFGRTGLSPEEEFSELPGGPDLMFMLQLTPELAETIAQYGRVCFVDAHTGAIGQEVRFAAVAGGFQASPLTHHMTPATCLSIAQALYRRAPPAVLLSVRGYEFGFSPEPSSAAAALLPAAVDLVMGWLSSAGDSLLVDPASAESLTCRAA